MALQKSVAVRNAQLDAIETTIGTAAVMKFFAGAQPANCAAADSGSAISSLTLPSDWLAAAASGSKAKLGTWTDASAVGGTIGHWRIYASNGTTCGLQGSATGTGGGGDVTVNNVVVTAGQSVTITSFQINAAGA